MPLYFNVAWFLSSFCPWICKRVLVVSMGKVPEISSLIFFFRLGRGRTELCDARSKATVHEGSPVSLPCTITPSNH